MAIGPEEIVRSEVEGGLSGPANPIPKESIDCGCGQLPCPKLARFATRSILLVLLCFIGLLQAACSTYLYVASPTISRRFQFNPTLTEWILVVSEIAPLVLAIPIAYWGDRIHRAAWTGGFVMVHAVAYCTMIIPHLAQTTQIIEETVNVTHMSIYADDSPEICSAGISMMARRELSTSYVTLVQLIVVQIFAAIATIAFFALGLSYIDDNTKKKNVAIFIGCILSMKFFGMLFGCLLAWGCLRKDADTLQVIDSYQEQIGAWWLGFLILGLLMFVPGCIIAIFPRRLPSEVVEEAAADILDNAGGSSRRSSYRTYNQKFGSTNLIPSLVRLCSNKIVVFNILAMAFTLTAFVNFMSYDNIFLESRYYIPRPSGMYLGFGDPSGARLASNILRPIAMGLVVIVTGLLIAFGRPKGSYVAGYNVVILALTATLFLALAYATCEKDSIVGEYRDSLMLLKYCNKNCRCSKDADFRPVCDLQGKLTFYSACHAGCTRLEFTNNTKFYEDCSCVQDMLGLGNTAVIDGACKSSSCTIGWIVFQVSTALIAVLLMSSAVGNVIIIFRSIYPQDKALSIGLHMSIVPIFVFIPGKLLYQLVVDRSCRYWGTDDIVCHLYDSSKLGDYLCYMSAAITLLGAIFQFFVWVFGRNLMIYGCPEDEHSSGTELQTRQALVNAQGEPAEIKSSDELDRPINAPMSRTETAQLHVPPTNAEVQGANTESGSRPLQFGPQGRGKPRTTTASPIPEEQANSSARIADTEDELDSSSEDELTPKKPTVTSNIAYRPLELDSDLESDLSNAEPRSRRNVLSRNFDPVVNNVGIASFPVGVRSPTESEIEEEEDPSTVWDRLKARLSRSHPSVKSLTPPLDRSSQSTSKSADDGFGKTDSFEYRLQPVPRSKFKVQPVPVEHEAHRKTGDFNEVGIPTIDSPTESNDPRSPFNIQSIQLSQPTFQGHLSQEDLTKVEPRDHRDLQGVEIIPKEIRPEMLSTLQDQRSQENLSRVPPPVPEKPSTWRATSTYLGDEGAEDPSSVGTPKSIEQIPEGMTDPGDQLVVDPEVPRHPTSPPPQSSVSSGFGSSFLSDSEEKGASPPPFGRPGISASRQSLNKSSSNLTSPTGDKPVLVTDF